MRRRTVLAQLVVFAAISLAIIGYTVFGLLRYDPTSSPMTVTVQLARAGGIFDGSDVTFRGVHVGRVDSLTLHPDGVTITLRLDEGTEVPDNSVANVFDLSPVGEQYVDLRPPDKGASATFLHDGSVIPRSRTTTPIATATVLYDLEQFVDSISPADVAVLGREGALAFTGTGSQLRSILENTTEIVDQLSTSEPAMLRLLDNATTLLSGAAAHTGDLDRFTASLRQVTSTLASSTPKLTALLQQAAPTTRLIDSLITQTGSTFVPLLNGLATLSDIQVARIPALKQLLVAVPEFAQLAPTIVYGGALHGFGSVNQSQPLCNTGIPLTSPISGVQTPVSDVGCGTGIVRGAANAPRPGGSAVSSAGIPSALPTADGTQVGGYDPGTDLASTSDGQLYRFGTNGGQSAMFGDNSWKAVLLAGVGS